MESKNKHRIRLHDPQIDLYRAKEELSMNFWKYGIFPDSAKESLVRIVILVHLYFLVPVDFEIVMKNRCVSNSPLDKIKNALQIDAYFRERLNGKFYVNLSNWNLGFDRPSSDEQRFPLRISDGVEELDGRPDGYFLPTRPRPPRFELERFFLCFLCISAISLISCSNTNYF